MARLDQQEHSSDCCREMGMPEAHQTTLSDFVMAVTGYSFYGFRFFVSLEKLFLGQGFMLIFCPGIVHPTHSAPEINILHGSNCILSLLKAHCPP